MTSRQRLQATLNHEQPDRLCVDFGAGFQTGLGAGALYRLRQAVLGDDPNYRVKVHEPYQMLGEVDAALREALQFDVVGVHGSGTMFGFGVDGGWKDMVMMDGTPIRVPEKFNITEADDGGWLMHPQGDTSAPARGHMPKGGYFFDALIVQEAIDEAKLDPADNCEEFSEMSPEDAAWFASRARQAASGTDCGVYMTLPDTAFGDIALVPAPWAARPKGIRDVEEWYISLLTRPDYIRAVFDRQLEVALHNIDMLAEAVGDNADVVFVSGTDFGHQQGLFASVASYRELFKPYHTAVNRLIHEKTNWKTFIHSCGSVYDLIGEFIEAGFDVLNPVQCSAAKMDAATLKKEFGGDVVFWGGGVDTQKTLPFGKPEEVYLEVRQRIDDLFSDGTGFVFNSIHNVQSNVPTDNLLAVFRALNDARGI